MNADLKDTLEKVRLMDGYDVSLSRLITELGNVKGVVESQWGLLKGSVVTGMYVSSLNMPMYSTNIKFSARVNVDLEGVLDKDKALNLLVGFLISDASITYNRVSISTPDVRLVGSLLYVLGPLYGELRTRFYVTVVETGHGPKASFHVVIDTKSNSLINDLVVSRDTVYQILNDYRHALSDDLRVWLGGALDGWDGGGWVRVRKQVRFVYYALRGLVGRDSLFTWYLGDGVRGHFERGGFDIGFSMVFDKPVIRFANEYLAELYGFSGAFFGGSGARGSEYYVRCPVKALVIEDIRRWAEAWPRELLTDRVLELLEALRYGRPCLSYRRWPTIDIDGFELILRKHNMGRGWYLTKSSSDLELLEAIANRLRELGASPSIGRSSGGYMLYVPIEDTKRILRGLGLYERFYGEPRKLPSIDDVINVLRKFSIRRWHVHVGRERNSRGYEYEVKCLLISLGDSTGAKALKEELTALGIRVRKVVWGTVIICNQEDRDLTLRALELLSDSGP